MHWPLTVVSPIGHSLACAAASRRLRYYAQHHLFATVCISQSPSRHDWHRMSARLLCLLKSNPHLVMHIRIVGSRLQYLYGSEELFLVFDTLLDVIPSMSFVGNKWFLAAFPSDVFACHHIMRVELKECVVHCDEGQLERFLNRFPGLGEMEAVNCVYRGLSAGRWGRVLGGAVDGVFGKRRLAIASIECARAMGFPC